MFTNKIINIQQTSKHSEYKTILQFTWVNLIDRMYLSLCKHSRLVIHVLLVMIDWPELPLQFGDWLDVVEFKSHSLTVPLPPV